MELNDKKINRLSRVLFYTISISLCGFLIGLSFNVMNDLEDWQNGPELENFTDTELIQALETKIDSLEVKRSYLIKQNERINSSISAAEYQYETKNKSFENWLKTRVVVASSKEDTAVINRAKRLDDILKTKIAWTQKQNAKFKQIEAVNSQIRYEENLISIENDNSYEAYSLAIRENDTKVFLIRLAIILPMLLLAILAVLKWRKHKYWSLMFGFVLFAFYAFFIGLVPYMPSYGGYVRFIIGIVICILLGIYAINKLKKLIEVRREKRAQINSEEDLKIHADKYDKALDQHNCPCCGKDFLVKNWHSEEMKSAKNVPFKVSDYCRNCGTQLFINCATCEKKKFTFSKHCSSCGS